MSRSCRWRDNFLSIDRLSVVWPFVFINVVSIEGRTVEEISIHFRDEFQLPGYLYHRYQTAWKASDYFVPIISGQLLGLQQVLNSQFALTLFMPSLFCLWACLKVFCIASQYWLISSQLFIISPTNSSSSCLRYKWQSTNWQHSLPDCWPVVGDYKRIICWPSIIIIIIIYNQHWQSRKTWFKIIHDRNKNLLLALISYKLSCVASLTHQIQVSNGSLPFYPLVQSQLVISSTKPVRPSLMISRSKHFCLFWQLLQGLNHHLECNHIFWHSPTQWMS